MPQPPVRFGRHDVRDRSPRRRTLSPSQYLALSFAALIAAGTLLLALPWASAGGTALPLVDALFTATSAVCVTGLIVVDTQVAFSTFGEVVLLLLIACGGLGYMTISSVAAVAVGRRLTLHERVTLQESLNLDSREAIVRFAGTVFKTALAIEATGAVLLWWAFATDHKLGRAAYLGLFHAVSAFNNAGFSLFSDNLMAYRGHLGVNTIVAVLIVLGGLGFPVLQELRRHWSFDRWSLHTRIVLVTSGLLWVGGFLVLLAFEWHNPATLGSLPMGEAMLAAAFQSVSSRTAGFNTIDIGALTTSTLYALLALMFIGAAPGGTAGGIKVTTFWVTVLALWTTMRGGREPVAFGRRLAPEVVARAFFVALVAFLAVNVVTIAVLVAERRDLLRTLFETTSAFGTVGLSMGAGDAVSLAGHFSQGGKLLTAAMMFAGRVGPLTLAIALVARRETVRLRHPEGRVLLG